MPRYIVFDVETPNRYNSRISAIGINTVEDGSITETILYVRTPLRAGQLRIIKCKAYKNGGVEPTNMNDHTVGVSITTDWGDGWHFEPDL